MADQYFVADDRKRGALSWQTVWDLARTGEVAAGTLILLPGASRWQHACEIGHLRHFFPDVSLPELPAREIDDIAVTAPAALNSELAGPYSRFLARLIDYVIFVPINMTLFIKAPGILDFSFRNIFGPWVLHLSLFYAYIGQVALMWLLVQLMLALCLAFTGTSPGKAILGLNVRSLKNESPLRLHMLRELKIWVLVICVGFHTAAVFQLGRQYMLLRFGQPTIYDGESSVVEGRPSAARFALVVGAVLLLAATLLRVMVVIDGRLPFWPF